MKSIQWCSFINNHHFDKKTQGGRSSGQRAQCMCYVDQIRSFGSHYNGVLSEGLLSQLKLARFVSAYWRLFDSFI